VAEVMDNRGIKGGKMDWAAMTHWVVTVGALLFSARQLDKGNLPSAFWWLGVAALLLFEHSGVSVIVK